MNSVFTVKELCELLRISRTTAYRLLAENTIQSIRLARNGKYIIQQRHIDAFLSRNYS